MAVQLPSQAGLQVLHSSLTANGIMLMASDAKSTELARGNAITLFLQGRDEDEVTVLFEKLSRNGKVRTPLHQTFGGGTCGEFTDRFGIDWIFNCSRQA